MRSLASVAMHDQVAARLQRYLRVAYEGAESGSGTDAAPRHTRASRWATRTGAAVRVAAVLLVLVVAGVTVLVLSRTAAPAAPQAPTADPAPPATTQPAAGAAEPTGGPTAGANGAAMQEEQPGAVVVHVAGAVAAPGLVELPAGSRAADALEAAGGATDAADLDALNLAAPVTDGQQLYVPAEGETPPVPVAGGEPGGAGGTQQAGLVDVNTADTTTLETLPGIGPALAGRIVDHRTAHGPFASVDALIDVAGIGPATLARIRDLVTV